ncbi:DUF3472 domain-containing protein [Amycolatopsis sp. PS_44_ISF1]|uniref:DUF3472 domain-containing protein n=1 Tax=Amycolatopsis sp. PS_44_ISF1 TaxID=2974917 RepID=UPI0028DED89D|nr:hypothetical protein [Amycolatopsis sp. PS_44_ISF1]MDT8912388.1 hypothetical protein [Amycolatopsis sp. PS_44_ISF1]
MKTKHGKRLKVRFVLAAAVALAAIGSPGPAAATPSPGAGLTPGGLAGVDWQLDDSGSSGAVNHLSFPFTVEQDSGRTPYYWAQQFYFANGELGYTGVQPGGGGRFLFSVFGSGPTTTDAQCSDGADGGAGVSCAVSLAYTKGQTYRLLVDHTSGTTWAGTVLNASTGARTHIGSWSVPGSWGSLQASGNGFVEYYAAASSCQAVPLGAAVFGDVSSSDAGPGTSTAGEAYGTCKGLTPVTYTAVSGGLRVTTGR